MQLKINLRHPKAVMPKKANPTDAGFDAVAVDVKFEFEYVEYDLGFGVEVPVGYMLLIFPRSSLSKYDLLQCNSVGVVDHGYNGNVKVRFKMIEDGPKIYQVGDKVCQLILMPLVDTELVQVDEISGNRDGFGSTGK